MNEPSPPPSSSDHPSFFLRRVERLIDVFMSRCRRGVDHVGVIEHIDDGAGSTNRYLIMTALSAAIAVLGMMLNSPAVVIGAMLLSPLMGPIVSFGFSLSLLDWKRMRRSFMTLLVGFALAFLCTWILSLVSPLKEATTEILARTRPNFFDLLIAMFSGIAGAYAVVRQRDETIIGVAIATALMPPIAAIGFGVATLDLRVAGGAFFLFVTNLVAISLSGTVIALFYGFRPQMTRTPAALRFGVLGVFAVMSVPLVLSLQTIAHEGVINREARVTVNELYAGEDPRIGSLEVLPEKDGTYRVKALVFAKHTKDGAAEDFDRFLKARLGKKVKGELDQVSLSAPDIEQYVNALRPQPVDPAVARRTQLSAAVPFDTRFLGFDEGRKIGLVLLAPQSGLDLEGAFALEGALQKRFADFDIHVVPPTAKVDWAPLFASDGEFSAGFLRAKWAYGRWGRSELAVVPCGDLTEALMTAFLAKGQDDKPPYPIAQSVTDDCPVGQVKLMPVSQTDGLIEVGDLTAPQSSM